MSEKTWLEYEISLDEYKQGVGWNHPAFDSVRRSIEEENAFIENPFEVAEGVVECKFCKSTKTYSYQKQVRSADEGFTTFVSCFNCKGQFRNN